jgi:hypothetical protein
LIWHMMTHCCYLMRMIMMALTAMLVLVDCRADQ